MNNPFRFIDAFVDHLDLAVSGFAHVTLALRGRPGYDPVDLLKLYIYGHLDCIRSSRCLGSEAYRDLEVIWLKPDFKTIADFRGTTPQPSKRCFASSWLCAGIWNRSGAC